MVLSAIQTTTGKNCMPLPTKLGKEPLIDGLFEVRFPKGSVETELLPALLFANIADEQKRITRLPVGEIPSAIRNQDNRLQFAPLVQIDLDKYVISIGERLLSVGCKIPYPGWKAGFRARILDIFHIVKKLGVIPKIERHSIKYRNIIQGNNLGDRLKDLNFQIMLGTEERKPINFNVRYDWRDDVYIHICTIVSEATADIPNLGSRSGTLLDIDTIQDFGEMPFDVWLETLEDSIDAIRKANKMVFFECLTNAAIEAMEPVYE